MSDPMNDSTVVRLDNLERELIETKAELSRVMRRNLWFLGGGFLMAGLLALIWMFMDAGRSALAQGGAMVLQDIRARRFILVDERGKDCALLSYSKSGPMLAMNDDNGNTRIILNGGNDGAGLLISDENGKLRAELSVDKDSAKLKLEDEKSKPRATLAVTKIGIALGMVDEKGTARALMGTSKDVTGLALFDKKGKLIKSVEIPY